jgi:hypothetical protein
MEGQGGGEEQGVADQKQKQKTSTQWVKIRPIWSPCFKVVIKRPQHLESEKTPILS